MRHIPNSKKWLIESRFNDKIILEPCYQQLLISKEHEIIKDKAVNLFRLMIDVRPRQYEILRDFDSFNRKAKRGINDKLESVLQIYKQILRLLKSPANLKRFKRRHVSFKKVEIDEKLRFEDNYNEYSNFVLYMQIRQDIANLFFKLKTVHTNVLHVRSIFKLLAQMRLVLSDLRESIEFIQNPLGKPINNMLCDGISDTLWKNLNKIVPHSHNNSFNSRHLEISQSFSQLPRIRRVSQPNVPNFKKSVKKLTYKKSIV